MKPHFHPIKRIYTYVYLVVLLLELLGEALWSQADIPYLVYVIKPMLMPVLMVSVLKSVQRPLPTVLKLLLTALFFSWMGDVLLMFVPHSETFFLAGLVSFLLAHVLYVVIFVKYIDKVAPFIVLKRPWLMLPFLLLAFGLLSFIANMNHPAFAEMKIPVIVYSGIITMMVLTALNRYKQVNHKSFQQVFLGAVLFMISDSLIAVNNFTYLFEDKGPLARILIMTLYAIGQYLIVIGIIRQYERPLS